MTVYIRNRVIIEHAMFLATAINNLIAVTQLKEIFAQCTGQNVRPRLQACTVYIYFNEESKFRLFPIYVHVMILSGNRLRNPYIFFDTFRQLIAVKFSHSIVARPLILETDTACQIYFDCVFAVSRITTLNCRALLFPHLHNIRHFYMEE